MPSDAWPAQPEEGYGLEKLFYGPSVRVVRFHNVYGPLGTLRGRSREGPRGDLPNVSARFASCSPDTTGRSISALCVESSPGITFHWTLNEIYKLACPASLVHYQPQQRFAERAPLSESLAAEGEITREPRDKKPSGAQVAYRRRYVARHTQTTGAGYGSRKI
jgi:hypothetical protein